MSFELVWEKTLLLLSSLSLEKLEYWTRNAARNAGRIINSDTGNLKITI